MGAWVDDRLVEEEEVVQIKQKKQEKQEGLSKTRTYHILGHVCDGGGVGTGQLCPDIIFALHVASVLLLPLRRQFSRQLLYEWPCIPLFKSRTKLDPFF